MIPEAAVEAAARMHYASGHDDSWDDTDSPVQDLYMAGARRILEAAWPHINPVAWDDLKTYEQQQGGYWAYGPHVGLHGEGKEFIRVSRPTP